MIWGEALQWGKVCNGFSAPLQIFRGKVCNGRKVCNITPGSEPETANPPQDCLYATARYICECVS